jgi:hypothetical protein
LASALKLHESPDFRDAIIAAKDYFGHSGLTEQLIEKDYYVTEALRIIATRWPTQVIFKGGTSLSKGWKLIERFSEDIDLFLNREAYEPQLSRNAVDRELKGIRDAVGSHSGLTHDNNGSFADRGVARKDYFAYRQSFPGIAAVANRILLEAGTRSGTYPIQTISLSSYLYEFLQAIGQSLGAEDESAFDMKLLDFRRTFVEKLFTIHSKVRFCQQENVSIGIYARHYYDLFCLAQRPEVQSLLRTSDEYLEIKQDCDRIGQEHFSNNHWPPERLVFSQSEALFPEGEIRQTLAKEYESQCRNLCYGDFPNWEDFEACFAELRDWL